VRDPAELLRRLGLEHMLEETTGGQRLWPLRVPEPFLRRMRPGDPADPLLRQVLPLSVEGRVMPGYSTDPLREGSAAPTPGLLRKYAGRALVIATGACAIHCRYCFRRHFPYGDTGSDADWERVLVHLRRDGTIGELILSGGDPLSLSDARLAKRVAALRDIPHLHTLRIHTRFQVVIPSRVCEALLAWMERIRQRLVVVIHANHANELDDPEVREALQALRAAGAMLLNQSVLLRGVNDSVARLRALSEALLDNGTLPYYLHVLDPVQGAAHFRVADHEARRLRGELQRRLPGYLVPRLVREVPGTPHKTCL
jgi:EF-P beta-lysylation protein EpmB